MTTPASARQPQIQWGPFASAADLPNASGNPLTSQDFVTAVDQIAYVVGVGVYRCTAPGTVMGGDATWVLAATAATTSGTTSLTFGALPGSDGAAVDVTGQAAILTTSRVRAWVRLDTTADHSPDEARVESLRVSAGNIVAGTGFTIYADCVEGLTYGVFNVNWEWS